MTSGMDLTGSARKTYTETQRIAGSLNWKSFSTLEAQNVFYIELNRRVRLLYTVEQRGGVITSKKSKTFMVFS